MPVSHNNMALPTAQQNLTIAMNSGEYPAVEVALARKVDGNVRYGEKCVADAKQMISPYIDANRIGSKDQLLACIICHQFNPAKYPLPVNLSTMVATRDALYTAVTQGAIGFNAKHDDAADILTSSGRDSSGNEVASFVDRFIKPVSSIFTDLNKEIPFDKTGEMTSIAPWYILGYTLFKNRKENGNNAGSKATDIADVFDNYIDSNKGSLKNPNTNTTGMPIVKVDVNNINIHTKLAPVKIEKLIMKVSGINFVASVAERVSKVSRAKVTTHVSDNKRVYDALFELFTTSSSIQSMQRQNTYASEDENGQLSLFEAENGVGKEGQIDALIDQIGELPVAQIERIREELINRLEDVFEKYEIYDIDASAIKNIVFFGSDNCLSENSNRGMRKNGLLLKKGKEFAKKMAVINNDPLTVQIGDHRVTIENPDTMETEVYPYAIHGYISMDKNESLIKVTGLVPFTYQNSNGDLVQDLGETEEIKEFRGILDDVKHGSVDKYIDSRNTSRLYDAGFNNVLSSNDIVGKIGKNIDSVVDTYITKYVDHAAKANPETPVSEDYVANMKVRYQGIIGKRVSTAASYMKSLDDSRQQLVKALSTKHKRSANTIFLKYFDKGNLIVNNATGNKASIDAGELNQQKYEAIRLYAANELGDDVSEWDTTSGGAGYIFTLTAINQQLFNANRNTSNAVGSIEVIRMLSTKIVNTVKVRSGVETIGEAIKQITSSTNPVMDEKMKTIMTRALDTTENVLTSIAAESKRIDTTDNAFVAEIGDIVTQISDVTDSDNYTGNNLEFIFSLGGLSTDDTPTMYVRIKQYINELGKRAVKASLNIPDNIINAIDDYYDNLTHVMSDVNNEGHKISSIISDAYQVVCGDGLTGGVATTIGSLSTMFTEGARIISGEIYQTAKMYGDNIIEIPGDVMRPEEDVYGALPEVSDDNSDNTISNSSDDDDALDNASYEQEFDHSYSDEYNSNVEQQSEGMIALHSIATELNAEDAVTNAITLYDESNHFIKKYQNSVYDTKNRMVSSIEGIMYRTINLVMSELIDYVLDKPRVTTMENGASRLVEINDKLKEISSLYSNGRMNSKYVINRFNNVVNAFNSAAAAMSGEATTISNREGQVNPVAAKSILGILNTMDNLGQSIERDADDSENTLLNAASGKNEHLRHDKIAHFDGSSVSLSDMTKSDNNLKDQYGHDAIVDAFARAIIAPPEGQTVKGKKTELSDDTVNHYLAMSRGMNELLKSDTNLRNRAMSLGELFGRNDYAPTSGTRDENLSRNSVDISRPDDLVNGTYMGQGTKNTDRMNVPQDNNYKTAAQAWTREKIKHAEGLIPNLYTGVAGNNVSLAIINDIFDDERRFEGETYPTVKDTVTKLLTGGDVSTYKKNLSPTETEPGANGETRTMYNTKGSLVVVHSGEAMTEEQICEACGIPSISLTDSNGGQPVVTDESIKPFVIAIRKNIVNKMIDTACNNWGNSSDSRLNHIIAVNRNNPNSIYTDKAKFNSILKDKLGNQSASDTSIPLAELVVSLNPDVMTMALDNNAKVTQARATNNAGINGNNAVVKANLDELIDILTPATKNSDTTPVGLLFDLAYAYASNDKDRIADVKTSDETKLVMKKLGSCGVSRTKLIDTIMDIYGAPIRENLEDAREELGDIISRLREKFPDRKFTVDGQLKKLFRDMAENPERIAALEKSTEYPEYKSIIDHIRATGVPMEPHVSVTGATVTTLDEIVNTFKSIDATNDTNDNDEKLSEIVQPNTTKSINTDAGDESKTTVTDLSKAFIKELRSGIGESVRKLARMGKSTSFIKNYIIGIASEMNSRKFDLDDYITGTPEEERDIVANIATTFDDISKKFDFPIKLMPETVSRILEYDIEHPEKTQVKHFGKLGTREMNIAAGKNVVNAERFDDMYRYLYRKSIVDEIDTNTYQLYDTIEQKPIENKYINAFKLYTEVKKISSIQNTVHPDRVTEILFRRDMDTPTATPLLDDMVYYMLSSKVVIAENNEYSVNDSNLKMSDNQFIGNVIKAFKSSGKKISDPVTEMTEDDRKNIVSVFITEVKRSDIHKPMPKANMRYMTDTDKDTLEKTEVINGKKVCGVCHGTGKVDGHVCPQCKGMPEKVEFQKSAPEIVGTNDVSGPVQSKNNVITPKEPAEDTPLTESIAVDFWDRW